MVCYTLKLKNEHGLPIEIVASKVKAVLLATLADVVTINAMSQSPPILVVDLMTVYDDPVKVAETLKVLTNLGITIEAVQ